MRRPILIAALVSVSLLTACKQAGQTPAADSLVDTTPPATIDVAAWTGKWTGPEGMYATITSADGKVSINMQSDLDTKGTYEGMVSPDGIRFKRGEEMLLLKKARGDETGLKYLAGKKDCLMVKSGEGYCRD